MSSSDQSGEVLIEAERIRVEFEKLVAVQDLSLQLRAGHLLGLIGPNGAGKTTLLRALAGLQPLAAGRVRVLGQPIVPGASAILRHIGFTPDNPPVYEELTVRRYLQFIANGYGLESGDAEARLAMWIERVWLTEKLDQKIKTLSRGMRQRIGLARTLMPDPMIVLLDEPAAGLDPAGRVQFRRLLCTLRDQGKAIIVSSHILADMSEYCTHIAIMAHGSLVQYGTVQQVAGSGDGERCRYTMTLVRPVPALRDTLEAIPGVVVLDMDNEQVIIEYSRNRADAADLLRQLVRADLAVASFHAHAAGLEEAYLRAGIKQVD